MNLWTGRQDPLEHLVTACGAAAYVPRALSPVEPVFPRNAVGPPVAFA